MGASVDDITIKSFGWLNMLRSHSSVRTGPAVWYQTQTVPALTEVEPQGDVPLGSRTPRDGCSTTPYVQLQVRRFPPTHIHVSLAWEPKCDEKFWRFVLWRGVCF